MSETDSNSTAIMFNSSFDERRSSTDVRRRSTGRRASEIAGRATFDAKIAMEDEIKEKTGRPIDEVQALKEIFYTFFDTS